MFGISNRCMNTLHQFSMTFGKHKLDKCKLLGSIVEFMFDRVCYILEEKTFFRFRVLETFMFTGLEACFGKPKSIKTGLQQQTHKLRHAFLWICSSFW